MAQVAVISPFSVPAEASRALAGRLEIGCRAASSPDEAAIHHEIRRRVFVEEQGFFEGSDRDAHDEQPATIKVLGLVGPVAGGAVRLYPLDDQGEWKGDRLAVLPEFRKHGLGAPLVRFAVRSAGDLGGRRMIAYIQPPNVHFFERLGWEPLGEPADYVGHLHQQMAIDLTTGR
jgi:putative N-acetyltransferase (TIGR04045 family)